MTIRMKDIQVINDDLKKRKLSDLAKESEKPVSTKKAVMQLAPTLLQKKSQGFSTADLVELLSQHQITIKPRDLSHYLREYQKGRSQNSGKKTAIVKTEPKQRARPKQLTATNHHIAQVRKPRPTATNLFPAVLGIMTRQWQRHNLKAHNPAFQPGYRPKNSSVRLLTKTPHCG